MIYLRSSTDQRPCYMTRHSAACDLRSSEATQLEPLQRALVPCGVWIERVDWEAAPQDMIPELQIRARSGLAIKHGVTLINGVGTVDADYPDEIKVPLINLGQTTFRIEAGDRIAQMVLNLVLRIPNAPIGSDRLGGFGSTGL